MIYREAHEVHKAGHRLFRQSGLIMAYQNLKSTYSFSSRLRAFA